MHPWQSAQVAPRRRTGRPGQAHRVVAVATALALVAACGTSGSNAPTSPSQTASLAPSPALTASPAMPSPAPSAALFNAYPPTPLGPEIATALQQVLEDAVRRGAPDAIAAVVTPEGTWSGAAGIDGPDGRKATATDEFYIASLSKVFTSALIMRLAERGKIDLDAPLATYLGDLDVNTNGATVRQTLGMVSGLPDYPPTAAAAIAADPGHRWTPSELIAEFFVPPTKPAGSTYIYGNPGFLLLAIAAEHVTGTTYAAALREEVLDGVGATRILEQGAGIDTPQPWALPVPGHLGAFKPSDFGAGGVISCISSVSFSTGGGSLAGDAPSVAAWTWHLLAGEIVGRSSLDQMLPTGSAPHGLGLERLSGLTDRQAFGQTGSKTGYGSILAIFPDPGVVVVVFVNEPEFIVEPVVNALLKTATGS